MRSWPSAPIAWLRAGLQVRQLEARQGLRLTPTERLANSLGKLAAGVERLAQGLAQAGDECPSPATMLFAGRRSSSRRYLLLQNW